MIPKLGFLTFVVSLFLAGEVSAATLDTGVLFVSVNATHACPMRNVGKKPVDVSCVCKGTIAGSSTTDVCSALAPGAVCNVSTYGWGTDAYFACTITTSGGKNSVRATLNVFGPDGELADSSDAR